MYLQRPISKIAYVVVGVLVVLLIRFSLSPLLPGATATAALSLLWITLIYSATRLFRGTMETRSARPWWQATERARAGFIVGCVALIAALIFATPMFVSGASPEGFIAVASTLCVSLFFFHSSIRLRARASEVANSQQPG